MAHRYHPRRKGGMAEAKAAIMEQFGFDDPQADAIVKLRWAVWLVRDPQDRGRAVRLTDKNQGLEDISPTTPAFWKSSRTSCWT
ncbi:MAG: hypothetical protein ACLT5P_06715 [Flavonifractor plautii]